MAITTLNGVLAGMQPMQSYFKVATPTLVVGRPQSLWPLGGVPGPGGYNATLAGSNYNSSTGLYAGQIPHYDPTAGINSYLARFQMQQSAISNVGGVALLCDRIWDGQLTINSTASQSVGTVGWPTRDAYGLTNGDGIVAGIEVVAATSATAAALTSFTYTNQSGVGSRAGTLLDAPTAVAATAGQFYRIELQASDTGIRTIQSIQFSTAWTTGTVNLVAYRVLLTLELSGSGTPNVVDPVSGGLVQIFNGAVPFVIYVPSGTNAAAFQGFYCETQG